MTEDEYRTAISEHLSELWHALAEHEPENARTHAAWLAELFDGMRDAIDEGKLP